ncbi:hypothetical protein [Bacillus thuringiensis]|uniref:hypothetical protein n=2 Tax=Bacillaceae TaxID=186817 RepID=UPI0020D266EB|nr:hypothetical protein [Bacillus thuringiensis]
MNQKIQKIKEEIPDTCNIVLIEIPNGGLKDLVKIKSVLALDISTGELLKGAPYGKAKKNWKIRIYWFSTKYNTNG